MTLTALKSTPTHERRAAAQLRPAGRPVMFQSWRELLFLHWRFPASSLQPLLPRGLTLDTFDGDGWVGVVPFFMRNIRPCWSPAVPGVSNFLELNLRTYVYDQQGIPGVWFFSLDASGRVAVWWGRRLFHLPYHSAVMRADRHPVSRRVRFTSHRRGHDACWTCRYDYEPVGPTRTAAPKTLESFLIERYYLFARSPSGALYRGQVHHPPNEYSDVRLQHSDTHLLDLNGLHLPAGAPDHAVVSAGVDVSVFAPVRIPPSS